MKKVLLLLMFCLVCFGLAYADKTAKVEKDIPVNNAEVIKVPTDVLLTWESEVVNKGYKQGTKEYDRARALILAYELAFKDAHELSADGKFLEAAKRMPWSCYKAIYLYNHVGTLAAGEKNEAGEWVWNCEKIQENKEEILTSIDEALRLNDLAVDSGIIGKGSNSPTAIKSKLERVKRIVDDCK